MKKLALVFAIILPLTFLLHANAPTWITDPVLLLLIPGGFVGLFITGGHGGTHAENLAALIVGVCVNVAFYWFVLTSVDDLRRRFAKSPPNTR
jgi:hypothetical protein